MTDRPKDPAPLLALVAGDRRGMRFDVPYMAAGTPSSMVRVDRAVLFELVGGNVARISRQVTA
jgi:hypothetical protein